jgi:hypothetical protein
VFHIGTHSIYFVSFGHVKIQVTKPSVSLCNKGGGGSNHIDSHLYRRALCHHQLFRTKKELSFWYFAALSKCGNKKVTLVFKTGGKAKVKKDI